MLRKVHSFPGLLAALFAMVVALSGAVLSLEPLRESLAAPALPKAGMSVAALAAMAQAQHAEIDKITRSPSGDIVVNYFKQERPGADRLDPATGRSLGAPLASPFIRFVTGLHRSFLAGDAGRVVAGLSALAMALLALSGLLLVRARMGSWRNLFAPVRGPLPQRLHTEFGRVAVLGLMLSSFTGAYMSLAGFELVPDGSSPGIAAATGSGGARLPLGQLSALQQIDVAALRELAFPYAGDLTDTFRLTTADRTIQIDAATGEVLGETPHSPARRLYETVYMLHTGQGLWGQGVWPLALFLVLCSLSVPVFAVSGGLIWWRRRRGAVRIPANAASQSAEIVILVGSEGNTTWGFARTLHAALRASGNSVHVAPMNALEPTYAKARCLLILTATYGEGTAPASATRFIERLSSMKQRLPVAVLGFGDRSFANFCGFAATVEATMAEAGFRFLLETARIDRQSSGAFMQWGESLGAALGMPLTLVHAAERLPTRRLTLVERRDFGAEVQAPTAILTFGVAGKDRSEGLMARLLPARLPRFEAGDLVGIYPPGEDRPRFYSLASSSREGVLEICVRKQPGGLCSGFLHALQPGGSIEAFIRPNPAFRPNRSAAPLILIGAGAGIGPLVGFVRRMDGRRPVHLYWGGRSPTSDFLYRDELEGHALDGRLTALRPIFSRLAGGGYVQDLLQADAAELARLIRSGAQILVCGGCDMASGVRAALATILAPLGLDLARLKSEGLFVEDVY